MKLWGKREEAVKVRSMAEVRRLGGRTIDHLPIIDPTTARSGETLAARALVLYALVGLTYEAPLPFIRDWIAKNGLESALSADEKGLLAQDALDERTLMNLSWAMEAIYALLWAGGFVKDLAVDGEMNMDAMGNLPRIGDGEDGRRFTGQVRLRPYAELYAMRDLYYRAHWFARDADLKGEDPGAFSVDSIMERRKALEWLLDERMDWDDVEMST